MKAEFSEFTFGFSLVNELASALSCAAVPIFPSLLECIAPGSLDTSLSHAAGLSDIAVCHA